MHHGLGHIFQSLHLFYYRLSPQLSNGLQCRTLQVQQIIKKLGLTRWQECNSSQLSLYHKSKESFVRNLREGHSDSHQGSVSKSHEIRLLYFLEYRHAQVRLLSRQNYQVRTKLSWCASLLLFLKFL
ncbi:hypothetical protein FGO68_gene16002 [Halteria grandinella]|uniref:Uncharacterized protein n=1 Tax=Halteria grandinella TaxID=5974 RepID=A0A8J8P6X4_HALGN|nr:hypothetical protein FGO68_gene16002 [Halteria grandinella]